MRELRRHALLTCSTAASFAWAMLAGCAGPRRPTPLSTHEVSPAPVTVVTASRSSDFLRSNPSCWPPAVMIGPETWDPPLSVVLRADSTLRQRVNVMLGERSSHVVFDQYARQYLGSVRDLDTTIVVIGTEFSIVQRLLVHERLSRVRSERPLLQSPLLLCDAGSLQFFGTADAGGNVGPTLVFARPFDGNHVLRRR
jgi:hypothetical protein